MKPTLIARLEKLNDWRLLAGIAALIVLFTEFIVAAMNLLLQGDITVDFLITGLVAALIVAPLGLVLLKRLLQVLTHNRQLQTEIAAEHDKQNLNLALITAQIFIWELDLPSGKIQYDDNQLPLLGLEFGQPPHDIQQWIELVHPHDRAIFMEKFQAALQPESPFFDLEYRFSPIPDSAQQSGSWNQDDAWSHSGSWSWLHTRGRVNQRDANGNPLLAGGTTMNITARKVAELQSLDAQKRFELIFNSSPDVMVISKLPEGIISNVNDAFVANTGYSKQDAIGNTTVGLGFWSDAERHKMTEAIARDGQCRALEFDFTLKNGEKRTGSFSAVVSRLEGIPHLVSTVHDITERKQMENALKGSETRFRAIIEATPVPLALNDAAGNITYLNRAFHDTLGYTLADIPTLDAWWPLAYPDPQYRQHILQNWGHATEQAMVSNSDITSIEGEVRCKNGQTRTFIIGGSPLAGEQAYLYLVSLYDITERKQAALKLQRNESLLRTTLDSTDEGILMIGGNGSLLASNQRFMELWKIPQQISESGKDELLLNHVLDQLIDPQVFLDQVHRLYGSDDEARDTLYFKDGRVFSRFTRALIIDGQRGRIWCFKDITEQHQKDNELQASKSLLRTVIDTVPVRVFWKDHASRFLGCNLAFARDAGLSHPAELIGKDDTQMTWKDQAELYRADDRQVMTSGQAKLTFDEPQTTPDGHEIWLRTSKTPLYNQANEVVGIVGVYDDITEQKHNEQALQASEFKLRTVLDNVDAYIYLKDTDGHYLFANRPVRELWQTEMEDIVGFGDEKFFDAATTSNIRINYYRMAKPCGPKKPIQFRKPAIPPRFFPPSCRSETRPGKSTRCAASRPTSLHGSRSN